MCDMKAKIIMWEGNDLHVETEDGKGYILKNCVPVSMSSECEEKYKNDVTLGGWFDFTMESLPDNDIADGFSVSVRGAGNENEVKE